MTMEHTTNSISRTETFADGIDKSVRVIASAPQEEIDWAVLRLVLEINLSLNDGLQTKSSDEDLTTNQKTERLLHLVEEFNVSEREVRTVASHLELCLNGTITRAGIHYLLRDENIEESLDRLLRGGFIVQRATSEFGLMNREFGAIYPTKLGDRFIQKMYEVIPSFSLGTPPAVDPNV